MSPVGLPWKQRMKAVRRMTEEPQLVPGEHKGDSGLARASRKWLYLAVLSTVVAVVALGYSLTLMYHGVRVEIAEPITSTTGEPLTLVIGRTPGGQAEWSNYMVLMSYIQERIDRPIKIRYISDREAASGVFDNGEADGGFLCTRSYLLLEEKGVVKPLAAPITSGASTETAMIFVRSDSPFQTFADLEGRSVAISSRTSVSGAAYLYWLADQKQLNVEEYFGIVDVSPTQEDGLRKLANGSVDAAVGCSTEARAFPAYTFRAVETSPEYAMPPFVISSSMNPLTANAILEALLSFDARANLPSDSVLNGFTPVTSRDYFFSHELLKFVPKGEAE
jgi:ABC-type phosphate/phosphonate transport system substrate-binding protein